MLRQFKRSNQAGRGFYAAICAVAAVVGLEWVSFQRAGTLREVWSQLQPHNTDRTDPIPSENTNLPDAAGTGGARDWTAGGEPLEEPETGLLAVNPWSSQRLDCWR